MALNQFEIFGGRKTKGTLSISGNKNAILPMIAACLLTEDEVILENVPDIVDVHYMIEVFVLLGGEAYFEKNTLRLCAKKIDNTIIPERLCTATRTSILFVGPLVARLGSACLFPPGGDIIGRRRLDTHFYGLEKLGARLVSELTPYQFSAQTLRGADLFFDEASVTATEHILMTAVLAEGTTLIRNAAAEPHVKDLGEMLNTMGANISGLGTSVITINGVKKLSGCKHRVISDHIEAGSFLLLAAATGGGVTLTNTQPSLYWMQRRILERFNIQIEMHADHLILPSDQTLKITSDFGNAIPVISDGPWPQYASDLMACTLAMATQAQGTVLFFEKMFESRMYFVDRLISMGANAVVCDPHRVVISGPAQLRGSTITSPDIRAGMSMIIAALCAQGKSIIKDAHVIDRGYEHIVEKLQAINCDIKRI